MDVALAVLLVVCCFAYYIFMYYYTYIQLPINGGGTLVEDESLNKFLRDYVEDI